MAIVGVDTKCYILALFIRSDGERFLLGSGHYEFNSDQMHFEANTMANDVVEVQGNDGYLLAGQVRRPGTQSFDGYVGDGTASKTDVETYRRAFFEFFRKNYSYKVIYVFPDGSAIQRKRGFLVDAPTVKELYQQYPAYHVALNFEDINYYYYNEDADGQEIYGKSATIGLAVAATGGLIWDALGAVSIGYTWATPVEVSGSEITINNQLSMLVPIENQKLYGNTTQQTYSGKNILEMPTGTWASAGITWVVSADTISGSGTVSGSPSQIIQYNSFVNPLPPGTFTFSIPEAIPYSIRLNFREGNTNHNVGLITSGETSATFTTDWTTTAYNVHITGLTTGTSFSLTMPNKLQVEYGSTATSYEPYVGGTASPNPDYPQPVQTVTGEQTVKVHGKNLWGGVSSYSRNTNGISFVTNPNGTFTASGTASADAFSVTLGSAVSNGVYLTLEPGTYTVSEKNGNRVQVGVAVSGGNVLADTITTTSFTLTQTTDIVVRAVINSGTAISGTLVVQPMLEKSASTTTYEPYQSQTYTVDLGSTELCKIGDYQDYIYKSGDDWYVHKEIGKITYTGDASENWQYSSTSSGPFRISIPNSNYHIDNYTPPLVYTNYYTPIKWTAISSTTYAVTAFSNTVLPFRNKDITSLDDWKTWLGTHNLIVYYPFATPTDTKITDNTLIGQLEAIGAMVLFVGENNLIISANGTNLPAILDFEYYTEVDFDGAGYEWEPGGAGGDKNIMVDSIDNVYPLLTITGPAVNPTITNITTGAIFAYSGTVTASQVLKVDMMAKTATLNGVSVLGNVTQDWLYFKPGNNRVEYTTSNTDSPDALIEWQEIVG